MDTFEILEAEVAVAHRIGERCWQDVLERITPQDLARNARFEIARIRRTRFALRRRRPDPARQIVTRHADRPRARQHVLQPALDEFVVDELAHERRGNAFPPAGEHTFLDTRRDFVGESARDIRLRDERRDDARATPSFETAMNDDARRAPAELRVLVPRSERRAHARIASTVEDVRLRDARMTQLDQRFLDEILDLLDARQRRVHRRISASPIVRHAIRAVPPRERHLDEVRDLGRRARTLVARALRRSADSRFDETPLERHDRSVATTDARRLHSLPPRCSRMGFNSSRNCDTSLNSR